MDRLSISAIQLPGSRSHAQGVSGQDSSSTKMSKKGIQAFGLTKPRSPGAKLRVEAAEVVRLMGKKTEKVAVEADGIVLAQIDAFGTDGQWLVRFRRVLD